MSEKRTLERCTHNDNIGNRLFQWIGRSLSIIPRCVRFDEHQTECTGYIAWACHSVCGSQIERAANVIDSVCSTNGISLPSSHALLISAKLSTMSTMECNAWHHIASDASNVVISITHADAFSCDHSCAGCIFSHWQYATATTTAATHSIRHTASFSVEPSALFIHSQFNWLMNLSTDTSHTL